MKLRITFETEVNKADYDEGTNILAYEQENANDFVQGCIDDGDYDNIKIEEI